MRPHRAPVMQGGPAIHGMERSEVLLQSIDETIPTKLPGAGCMDASGLAGLARECPAAGRQHHQCVLKGNVGDDGRLYSHLLHF